ncbi:hypothetical protein CBR_g54241 [Chara braunii]|uniref:Uncharacterized protein n=1 Tax=Chara braunii TaxID=69332 RepID=A0A388K7E8_CHABU|nr:hypothetical protein CBR_g54241 [Chara braunii]|eukprot:GBG65949.1 hypothetical protein CBR_g54241 [Chara braunii]
MRFNYFWIKCLHIPVSVLPQIECAVEDAFGRNLKVYPAFNDPNSPELLNIRFDLVASARLRFKPWLCVDLAEYGYLELEIIGADTPWCSACRQFYHFVGDPSCPKNKNRSSNGQGGQNGNRKGPGGPLQGGGSKRNEEDGLEKGAGEERQGGKQGDKEKEGEKEKEERNSPEGVREKEGRKRGVKDTRSEERKRDKGKGQRNDVRKEKGALGRKRRAVGRKPLKKIYRQVRREPVKEKEDARNDTEMEDATRKETETEKEEEWVVEQKRQEAGKGEESGIIIVDKAVERENGTSDPLLLQEVQNEGKDPRYEEMEVHQMKEGAKEQTPSPDRDKSESSTTKGGDKEGDHDQFQEIRSEEERSDTSEDSEDFEEEIEEEDGKGPKGGGEEEVGDDEDGEDEEEEYDGGGENGDSDTDEEEVAKMGLLGVVGKALSGEEWKETDGREGKEAVDEDEDDLRSLMTPKPQDSSSLRNFKIYTNESYVFKANKPSTESSTQGQTEAEENETVRHGMELAVVVDQGPNENLGKSLVQKGRVLLTDEGGGLESPSKRTKRNDNSGVGTARNLTWDL